MRRPHRGLRYGAAILPTACRMAKTRAAQAIEYFAAQSVAVKEISEDSPLTVPLLPAAPGLPHAGRPVDARDLPEDPDQLGRLLEEHAVFGQVAPRQKQAMVTADVPGDGTEALAITGRAARTSAHAAARADRLEAEFCNRQIDAQAHRALTAQPHNPRDLTLLSTRVGNYRFHPYWNVLIDQLWVREPGVDEVPCLNGGAGLSRDGPGDGLATAATPTAADHRELQPAAPTCSQCWPDFRGPTKRP